MTDPVSLVLLAVGGLVAATLASVTGFGGAALLLPLTVSVFGVQDAIPILTIAQLMGNASRVWFNRQDVSIPVTMRFGWGCVPAAVLGGILSPHRHAQGDSNDRQRHDHPETSSTL